MKNLNYLVIALFAVFSLFAISCKNDNEDPPTDPIGDPLIQAPTGTSVQVNKDVSMSFNINAEGKVAEVTVGTSNGTAVIDDATSIIGKTSGIINVTYTAPITEGNQTVTLTVKDQQTTPKTVSASADVTVTLAPESSSELLVAKFASPPILDGEIDDVWNVAQKLVGTTEVPKLDPRTTYLNSDGQDVEENLGLFYPYSEDAFKNNDFTMRSGYVGDDIYFLIEWEDATDSKDRQSWYFDSGDKLWKQEHKYANAADDMFYEDKFAFLFPIGTVDGFESSSCYATCHGPSLPVAKDKDKHTRHYLKTADQKIDMWHWKRVRGTHNDRIDDQRIKYVEPPYTSSSNGRGGDPDSGNGSRSGYSNNKQTLNNGVEDVSVPKYVVPGGTDYYWIPEADLGAAAKLVTAVDADGILTYDGGTIDPTGDADYNQGTGSKRFPSILTRDFLGDRADITAKVTRSATGWVAEVTRKLNTNDPWDVVFDPAKELPFGFAIFDNAAIAHGIKPGLNLKFEQ